ncbi:O-antigen ligase family protein [Campylobacter sp. MOP7]|uniref:O-antigen ligase family protein n=1 Tax=Campylobacter canis TaxID=3378588 RepID=UPI00387ED4DE
MNNFKFQVKKIGCYLKTKSTFELVFIFTLFIWCTSIPFDNAIYQIGWVLLNLLFITHIVYYRSWHIIKDILTSIKPIVFLFSGLCLVMIASNLLNHSILSPKSWHHTIYFVLRFAFVFLALCYFYKLSFFRDSDLIYFFIFGICILAAGGLFQLIYKYQYIIFNSHSGYGLTGVLRNRNGFGLISGIGLVTILVFLKDSLLKNILLLIFVTLVAFSFSRSSWVASIVAISFYYLINLKTVTKNHIILVIIILSTIMIFYLLSDSLQHRFSQLIEGNSSHRLGIWSYTFSKIIEQPFFGYGLDSFQYLPNAPFLTNPNYSAPHNMIMEILFSTGIVGFIFFTTINLYILLTILKNKNYKIMIMFFYIYVVCQFDFGIFSSKELLSYVTIFSFLAMKDKAVV